jgi:hypothetical protein
MGTAHLPELPGCARAGCETEGRRTGDEPATAGDEPATAGDEPATERRPG